MVWFVRINYGIVHLLVLREFIRFITMDRINSVKVIKV